jgi:hypothetical protein
MLKRSRSPNHQSSSQNVPKKPFLARGTGLAGGKGLGTSNQKTPVR